MSRTRYRDLPEEGGVRHSWGLWGPEDRRGTFNRIDDAAVRRGLDAAVDGRVFSLNWQMDLPDPPLFRRAPMRHELVVGTNTATNDVISGWNTQGSSQWDGFRHVSWHGKGTYNGLPPAAHGVHHWAAAPIVTRAVVCDVGRWRRTVGRPLRYDEPDLIEVGDIESALGAGGIQVEVGDILLLETGWLAWYVQSDVEVRRRLGDRLVAPGLTSREEMAELLWDLGIAAVAADNPVLETWPQGAYLPLDEAARRNADPARRHEVALHVRLLPGLGMPIGELWDLRAVAEHCAATGRHHACLTSAPIALTGGAATPANAIAIT